MNRKAHFRTHVQGESLENRIVDLTSKVYEELLLPVFWCLLTVYCWLIVFGVIKITFPSTIVLTIIMIVLILRAAKRLGKIFRKIKDCRKGLDGERYVGNMIQKLASDRTYIFHDVVCPLNKEETKKFNIDHVIVSTRGIFVLETKNWSLYDREYDKPDFIFREFSSPMQLM